MAWFSYAQILEIVCSRLTKDILRCADGDSRPQGSCDAPTLETEDARRNCCRLGKQGLDSNETNEQYPRERQQSDDSPIIPLETVSMMESLDRGAGSSQRTSDLPTEVPTQDRLHQVPVAQCPGRQVGTSSA